MQRDETRVCDFGWQAREFDLPGVDGRRLNGAYRVQAQATARQFCSPFGPPQILTALVSASSRVAPEAVIAFFGPSASAAQPFLNRCTISQFL